MFQPPPVLQKQARIQLTRSALLPAWNFGAIHLTVGRKDTIVRYGEARRTAEEIAAECRELGQSQRYVTARLKLSPSVRDREPFDPSFRRCWVLQADCTLYTF